MAPIRKRIGSPEPVDDLAALGHGVTMSSLRRVGGAVDSVTGIVASASSHGCRPTMSDTLT
jgi:hypothetical protein